MKTLALALAAALCAVPGPASAAFHFFQIQQLFSTADGEVQFVVLREAVGANGENQLAGHTLTASRPGVSKSFMFPGNLPSPATANKSALIATQGYVDLRAAMPGANLPAPDYVVPNRFLPVEGGTLNYADTDVINFGALPADGTTARLRSGTTAPNVATNFAGASASVPLVPTLSVEFHHAGLDHYFQSSLAPDIDALDSGRTAGWARTGETFKVMPVASNTPAAFVPVCRFYIPPDKGDSHFFSAWDVECARILSLRDTDPNYAGYVHETPSAFFAVLPDLATGACPAGTRPVFRLWNGRVDSNHRFTASATAKAQTVARGFTPEGFGTEGVAMCVI
jgi:hypothetical protein